MQREISEQRKALSNTQQEKTVTLDKLNSLNQIIQQRQVVINNLGLEIRSVNYELTQKQKYRDSLTQENNLQKQKLKKRFSKHIKREKAVGRLHLCFHPNPFLRRCDGGNT